MQITADTANFIRVGYTFGGQDARTTRVSWFNFVLHQSGNCCKLSQIITNCQI